ncbi:putative amidoligase enzyme-domain-containing protein [Podospora fimiseda]|uniref:Amidoligase enzyme-domain-containing protein n=1 Tax=Podospora fimiseda TaxID=252190 RepID=A0AAN7BWT5_9PEZI|nr:putative amidoligase enzyme-domain-containing protein [Podospora fimiseda]
MPHRVAYVSYGTPPYSGSSSSSSIRSRSHNRHHDSSIRHRSSSRRRPGVRAEVPDFRFCIELGLVLRSRELNHKTSHELEREVSVQLTAAKVANILAASTSSSVAESSREWTVASEHCIPSQPKDHRFGIKLVSPFFRFSATRHENWITKISTVMRTLNKHFEVTSSHQCYTHVHIVPLTGYWKLQQLKSLARSAVYFERCLDEIVPPYRRRSVWAKSNRNNKYFGQLSMAECFSKIDRQSSPEGLAARMNLCDADSPTGVALRSVRAMKDENTALDFAHDTYRWNFTNLNEGDGFGTIEFRQAPGSTTSQEVMSWVMLVGCFARLSCGLGDTLKAGDAPQTKSLGEWLMYEAQWCSLPYDSLLLNLLEQATPTSPVPGKVPGKDADNITIDEDQRLRWKAGERKFAVEKYHRVLSHIH